MCALPISFATVLSIHANQHAQTTQGALSLLAPASAVTQDAPTSIVKMSSLTLA